MGCDKLPRAFCDFKYVGASDGANALFSLNGQRTLPVFYPEVHCHWGCFSGVLNSRIKLVLQCVTTIQTTQSIYTTGHTS